METDIDCILSALKSSTVNAENEINKKQTRIYLYCIANLSKGGAQLN